jgi:TonB family protein
VAQLQATGARLDEVTSTLAIRRDLAAADLALAEGRLLLAGEESAHALYTDVLARDPASSRAIQGLQSVRQELVNRTLALLVGDDLDEARRALRTATDAGVDPQLVADLESEIRYRQRLTDARAGRFESLYPFDQLVPIRQEPPQMPRLRTNSLSVNVEFTVSESGGVLDVVVLGDPPENVKRTILRALRDWRFEPVLADERPVPVRSNVRFLFRN